MIDMVHVMIDTETLATDIPAVTTSFAAVQFDPFGDPDLAGYIDLNKFTAYLDIEPQIDLKFKVNQETLIWWAKNPRIIPDCYPDSVTKTIHPYEFCHQFNSFLCSIATTTGTPQQIALWVRGTEFDLATLRILYQFMGVVPAWKYDAGFNLRDWLRASFGTSKPKELTDAVKEQFPAHGALNDCYAQIYMAQCAMDRIGNNITNWS